LEQVFDTMGLNINYYQTNRTCMSSLPGFLDILFPMRLENGFISLYSM